MNFTDDPNDDDSGNPTGPPAEPPQDGAPPPSSSFVVFMMVIAGVGLLILIITMVNPCTRRNRDAGLCGLEEVLPHGSSSSRSENQPLQPLPAQEAAQGSQDSQAQEEAQGLLQAEAPRDSNVTHRRRTKHVTWNASVVGGNDYCDAAANASDDAGEYVRLDELREDPRASVTQEPPRASPCDEELDQQDECAQNARADSGSRHATPRNDGSCRGAVNLPIICRRRFFTAVHWEGDYVTLVGLPGSLQVGNIANAPDPHGAARQSVNARPLVLLPTDEERRLRLRLQTQQNLAQPDPQDAGQDVDPDQESETESEDDEPPPPQQPPANQRRRLLECHEKEHPDDGPYAGGAASRSDRSASDRNAQAEGGELFAGKSSMSVWITTEELRRLVRQQQNIEDDIDEDDQMEGHGDKEATDLYSLDEEPLDDDSLGEAAFRSDRQARDLRGAQAEGDEWFEQSSMSVRLTTEELRRLMRQQQNIVDDIDEDDQMEGHGDREATDLNSLDEEPLDDLQLTQTAEDLRDAQAEDDIDEDDQMEGHGDKEATDLNSLDEEPLDDLQLTQTAEDLRDAQAEDDIDEDDQMEGHGDREATDLTSEEESFDDLQLTQLAEESSLLHRQNSDKDDKE